MCKPHLCMELELVSFGALELFCPAIGWASCDTTTTATNPINFKNKFYNYIPKRRKILHLLRAGKTFCFSDQDLLGIYFDDLIDRFL